MAKQSVSSGSNAAGGWLYEAVKPVDGWVWLGVVICSKKLEEYKFKFDNLSWKCQTILSEIADQEQKL